jgi:hypothetical protein
MSSSASRQHALIRCPFCPPANNIPCAMPYPRPTAPSLR